MRKINKKKLTTKKFSIKHGINSSKQKKKQTKNVKFFFSPIKKDVRINRSKKNVTGEKKVMSSLPYRKRKKCAFLKKEKNSATKKVKKGKENVRLRSDKKASAARQ